MKRLFVLSVAAVVCAACSTPESVENAGLSDWKVDFNEDGTPKSVRIIDGKEKANISFEVDMKTGTASYSATDVRAFDGQKFAAELGAVQSRETNKTLQEVAPDFLDGIVGLVRTYIGG